MSYHAFGERRQGDWRTSDPLLPIIPALTNRGFTGHEHIDEMGFIHMNGRVYDPSIGRFLSADPNVFHPYNTQDYNRYSYATNNPLKYVDMNGFGWFKKLFRKIVKIVVIVVVVAAVIVTAGGAAAFGALGSAASAITGAVGLATSTIGAIATGAKIGFLAGAVSTGSLKGAFKGAIYGGASAGLAQYIGHSMDVDTLTGVNKHIAHGFAQGASSQIIGGNFKDGFMGGFTGSFAGGYMKNGGDWSDIAGRTAIAAAAGGVAAELGGGKFANGARSAAFVHLFNHEGGNISKNLQTNNVVNANAGGSGSLFLGVGGVSASTGV
ncbi:RHS repeat-associated core domain-containing protein, partial [Bathymodiolus heckerae thiotrophic gill symbiont]|uniref:RHS repeat-associated core domain-containing protein n=1 Tax=Bathymodiolus heckerae thiotrophic gill symbiont TaxID=1052212 RepID=UPI0010FDC179